jgi:hypothetical protein
MSGEQLHDAVPSPGPEPGSHPLVPDRLLMGLVDQVNTLDMDVGVTLHVCGVVVSGTLISGSKFFGQISKTLKEAAARENAKTAEGLAEAFATVAESYRQWAQRERDQTYNDGQEALRSPTQYIHLQNAAVHAAGGPPPPGMLWRGRLAHVSGWSFGVLS